MKKKNDKWGKKQVFFVNSDPYKQDIIVVANGHFSDAVAFLKKQGTKGALANLKVIEGDAGFEIEHNANTGQGETWSCLPYGYVVTLSHQTGWIDTVDIIAHECMHLTHYILRKVDIVLCKESEEAYTYLQSHLITQILHKLY